MTVRKPHKILKKIYELPGIITRLTNGFKGYNSVKQIDKFIILYISSGYIKKADKILLKYLQG